VLTEIALGTTVCFQPSLQLESANHKQCKGNQKVNLDLTTVTFSMFWQRQNANPSTLHSLHCTDVQFLTCSVPHMFSSSHVQFLTCSVPHMFSFSHVQFLTCSVPHMPQAAFHHIQCIFISDVHDSVHCDTIMNSTNEMQLYRLIYYS